MDHQLFANYFQRFMRRVDFWTLQFRIKNKRGRCAVAVLRPEIRKAVHFHIQQIREVFESIELSAAKRDAIFNKLNALAEEVDRDRSQNEALMALVLEVADEAARQQKG